MSDEHVHRAVPSLRKEEDLSERFPRTMPTHITDTCRCGATRQKRVDVNGTVTRDVAVQIARLFWQGAKDHLDRKAKETLDPSVWGSLDAPGGGQ